MKIPISPLTFAFSKILGVLFKLRYWKFWIPFIIAFITIGVSITTSTIDSVEQGSFLPLITEVGGRITIADENLEKDAELLVSGEGGILQNINFFQKFIGDFFIFYTIIYFFYAINKLFLGNTNANFVIYGNTIIMFAFFQITFSLIFFQKLTVPFYGVIKSIFIILQYIVVM